MKVRDLGGLLTGLWILSGWVYLGTRMYDAGFWGGVLFMVGLVAFLKVFDGR